MWSQSRGCGEVDYNSPVSVLNVFSKVTKLFNFGLVTGHEDHFLSVFALAYRGVCGWQHVLVGLLEGWREQLYKNKNLETVLLDLSQLFDCIPRDLLFSHLNTYGLIRIPKFFFFHIWKTKGNDIYRSFLELLLGVP